MGRHDLRNTEYWAMLACECDFNASRMARRCGMSSRQLRRYCQSIFSKGTQEWLNEQRLIAAGYLLKRTGSVKAVSMELGFKQISHFSRQFKEHYGIPPTEFLQTPVSVKTLVKMLKHQRGDNFTP